MAVGRRRKLAMVALLGATIVAVVLFEGRDPSIAPSDGQVRVLGEEELELKPGSPRMGGGLLTVQVSVEGDPLPGVDVFVDERLRSTNSEGDAVFRGLPVGTHALRVDAREWGIHRDQILLNQLRSLHQVNIRGESTIRVVVGWASGTALKRVFLIDAKSGDTIETRSVAVDLKSTTRRDALQFGGLSPGRYRVTAQGALSLTQATEEIEIEVNGEASEVVLFLEMDDLGELSSSLSGTAFLDGQPIHRDTISISVLLNDGEVHGRELTTNRYGGFSVDVPFFDTDSLIEATYESGDLPINGPLVLSAASEIELRFTTLPPSHEVFVVGNGDVALSHCAVTLSDGRRGHERVTNASGIFSVDGLGDGLYDVVVQVPDLMDSRKAISWTGAVYLSGSLTIIDIPLDVVSIELEPSCVLDRGYMSVFIDGSPRSRLGPIEKWPAVFVAPDYKAAISGLFFEQKEVLSMRERLQEALAKKISVREEQRSRLKAPAIIREFDYSNFSGKKTFERLHPSREVGIRLVSRDGRSVRDAIVVTERSKIGLYPDIFHAVRSSSLRLVDGESGAYRFFDYAELPEQLWIVSPSAGFVEVSKSEMRSGGELVFSEQGCVSVRWEEGVEFVRFEIFCNTGAKMEVYFRQDEGVGRVLKIPILMKNGVPVTLVTYDRSGKSLRSPIGDYEVLIQRRHQ